MISFNRSLLNISLILLLSLSVLTSYSCKESEDTSKSTDTLTGVETTTSVVVDEEEVLDTSNDPVLLGKTKREQLLESPYDKWFTPTYQSYVVDKDLIQAIGPKLRDAHLTIYMGTWCEDSQREIPALFKILDQAEFNPNNYTLITISEEKDTPSGLEKGKNINFVPTIIVNVDGEEVNRIVEYPIDSLEKDLAKILNGEAYEHAYAE